MEILVKLSSFIIPGVMLFITIYGIKSKRNIYDDFVSGAADGLKNSGKSFANVNWTYGCCRCFK